MHAENKKDFDKQLQPVVMWYFLPPGLAFVTPSIHHCPKLDFFQLKAYQSEYLKACPSFQPPQSWQIQRVAEIGNQENPSNREDWCALTWSPTELFFSFYKSERGFYNADLNTTSALVLISMQMRFGSLGPAQEIWLQLEFKTKLTAFHYTQGRCFASSILHQAISK